MSGYEERDDDVVRVRYIKLAMWLKLNGHPLVQRMMTPEGELVYLFRRTATLDELIKCWAEDPEAQRLSRFASLVSFEIRRMLKRRRALGLPATVVRHEFDGAIARD
jgi:hypothetical protein